MEVYIDVVIKILLVQAVVVVAGGQLGIKAKTDCALRRFLMAFDGLKNVNCIE